MRSLLPGLLVAAVAVSGCSSSKETGDRDGGEDGNRLLAYESEFDPTAYNPDLIPYLREELPARGEPVTRTVEITNPPAPELVQGFRVQIYASTSIDEASEQKRIAEELFPEEWFYIVYDPPTYKIRAGNFVKRFEADRFLKDLRAEGYSDSWVVPDKIQKNALPRSLRVPVTDPDADLRDDQ